MIIAIGHFVLAFDVLSAFYLGLALIVVGTGLLKPNVSTLVGSLYAPGDARRDAGFSIFYMGINLGAFLGPLIAGYLAQRVNWHVGFAAAGVGMTLGLIQYVLGRQPLQDAERQDSSRRAAVQRPPRAAAVCHASDVQAAGRGRVFFIFVVDLLGRLRAGGIDAEPLRRSSHAADSVAGFSFPSSWFQSVPALFVILLAPVFAWLWTRLGDRQPSTPGEVRLRTALRGPRVPAAGAGRRARRSRASKVSPMWLVGAYFILELGELCLSPVGLSAVTKLAPSQLVGLAMGIWFLSNSAGNILAGWAGTFFSTMPLRTLFGASAIATMIAAFVLMLAAEAGQGVDGGTR